MSVIIFDQPGSKLGPCIECAHADCEDIRRLAGEICPGCGKPLGYQVRIVTYHGQRVHEECLGGLLDREGTVGVFGTQLADELESISIGCTSVVFGLVVTRWSQSHWEVETFGRSCGRIDEAVKKITSLLEDKN